MLIWCRENDNLSSFCDIGLMYSQLNVNTGKYSLSIMRYWPNFQSLQGFLLYFVPSIRTRKFRNQKHLEWLGTHITYQAFQKQGIRKMCWHEYKDGIDVIKEKNGWGFRFFYDGSDCYSYTSYKNKHRAHKMGLQIRKEMKRGLL